MLAHCTSLSIYFSDGVNETWEGREVKAEHFGGCEEEPSRNKGMEVPKCPTEVPRNERGCRGWGGWEERAMRRMSRTRRKGRMRMTTVTTMNDESSFLPNGSAKLKCQTHDARMRMMMMMMLQRFSMIQTPQMTGMIKVIRMNQWWG